MRVWNLDKPVQKCSGLSKTTPGLAFEESWLLTVGQLNIFASQVPLLP